MLEEIKEQTREIVTELLETARMEPEQILVVGCSSSEIASYRIGSHSSEEIGQAVFDVIYEETSARGIYLAAQCCEHLNRALILESAAAKLYGYEPVNVVPQLKAGGSFATAAYKGFEHPVAVEHIRAHAGIDIGDTFIGAHRQKGDRRGPCDLRQNPTQVHRRLAGLLRYGEIAERMTAFASGC